MKAYNKKQVLKTFRILYFAAVFYFVNSLSLPAPFEFRPVEPMLLKKMNLRSPCLR